MPTVDKKQPIIFDTFIRDGTLYLVSTFWSSHTPRVNVSVDGFKVEEHGLNQGEPLRYFSCKVNNATDLNIRVNGLLHRVKPTTVVPLKVKNRFAIATLFKHESPSLIRRFLEYYRKQGCDAFYLYYNGPVLPSDLPAGADIHYREWDYPYFNKTHDFIHCAQTTFLTTVRFRHFDDCNWLALIDMDEFIYNLDCGCALIDYIERCSDCDVIKIQNHWSTCSQSGGPITYSLVSNGWSIRTKCIYNRRFTGTFSIHEPKTTCKILRSAELMLLHVVNGVHDERLSWVKQPVCTTNINLIGV